MRKLDPALGKEEKKRKGDRGMWTWAERRRTKDRERRTGKANGNIGDRDRGTGKVDREVRQECGKINEKVGDGRTGIGKGGPGMREGQRTGEGDGDVGRGKVSEKGNWGRE